MSSVGVEPGSSIVIVFAMVPERVVGTAKRLKRGPSSAV